MSATSNPEQSCFLILDPNEQSIELLEPSLHASIRHKFSCLDAAADTARVPRYFSTHDKLDETSRWMSKPCQQNSNHVFQRSETKSVWQNEDLVAAIRSEGREKLFVCGFWLDVNLVPAALDAYVEGFDVHVVTDLVFSRNDNDHLDAMSRLTQIGIVPITTGQLVHEWMSWTTNADDAEELKLILDSILS